MNYDVNHFINKFSGIPDEKWISGSLGAGDPTMPHCALGHCEEATDKNGVYKSNTEESKALEKLFASIGTTVPGVNDNNNSKYTQETPKARILAALDDIKKKQEGVSPSAKVEVSTKLSEPITGSTVTGYILPPTGEIPLEVSVVGN